MQLLEDYSCSELDSADLNKLQRLADEICQRGLSTAAIFTFEMCKPFSMVGFNAGVTILPLLQVFFGREKSKFLLKTMQSGDGIEKLICMIEKSAKRDS